MDRGAIKHTGTDPNAIEDTHTDTSTDAGTHAIRHGGSITDTDSSKKTVTPLQSYQYRDCEWYRDH